MTFAERGGWWVVGQIALMALYALALIGTEPVREGIGLTFARGTGLALVGGAVVIGVWSMVIIRRGLTIYPAPTEGAELASNGPYRLVRHPIYLAVIMGTIGLALAALNPWALLMSLVFVPFFMAKTGHAEELLMEEFPAYREYRSTVTYRLIPWVM